MSILHCLATVIFLSILFSLKECIVYGSQLAMAFDRVVMTIHVHLIEARIVGVHMTLKDHLPPSAYYRFNPYLAESFLLDEIRPEKIRQMQLDAAMYSQKNEAKLQKAVEQLKLKRLPHQKLQDFISHQRKIMS